MGQFATLTSRILSRNPLRTLFLLFTIVGTMLAFMGTEAATRDLSASAADVWNDQAYDLSVTGLGAFSVSKQVGEMAGVRSAEELYIMPAIVNGNAGEVLVDGDGRMVEPKYVSGREPKSEFEIAVGRFIADRDQLEVGSDITLSKADGGVEAIVYKVCGIMSSPPSRCVMTKGGLTRLHPSPEKFQTVLVARDASMYVTKTRQRVEQMVKGTGIRVLDLFSSVVH